MKLRIELRDARPDGLLDAIDREAQRQLRPFDGLPDDEWSRLLDQRREAIAEQIAPWVEYGDFLTVEFDTDAGTATALKK